VVWERRRGGLVVGLRHGRAGGDDIVVMHGLVILNRWCLADTLDAKFAQESYKEKAHINISARKSGVYQSRFSRWMRHISRGCLAFGVL